MTNKTKSEVLFETFCSQHKIKFIHIPTMSKEGLQTPDYDIFIHNQKIIVEVKQIDPNPEDIEQLRIFNSGGVAMGGNTPGERVRNKIANAASQIKSRSKNKYPSILVIYNNVHIFNYTDPYLIRVAMYGLETIILNVPKNTNKPTTLIDKKFGPKQKMTINMNTSISAVAVLNEINNKPTLTIFHNIFSAITLSPDIFINFKIKQYKLEQKTLGEFQDWQEII